MTDEQYKGLIHFAAENLATTLCLYSALRWIQTREKRFAFSVALYAIYAGFETYQTSKHWGDAE